MKIEDILADAENLHNQSVYVEAYFMVIETNRQKIPFLSSTPDIAEKDQKQIFLDYSLAELKTIIRPLPTMQLLFRGMMTNPPYFYRFPVKLRATVELDSDYDPTLKDITYVELDVPYVGKMSDSTPDDAYLYRATVDYTPTSDDASQKTARATVKSQKVIVLSDSAPTNVEAIPESENRYARRTIGEMIQITGEIQTIDLGNHQHYLIFMTSALRASVVAVGPLKEKTPIWLRPSPLYQLLKSHIPISVESKLRQRMDITGKVDYLQDDEIMAKVDNLPKLVFTSIAKIVIHETGLLW